MVKSVRHTGMVVRNMDRSLAFYRDLLGLKEAKIMEESGAYIDRMLGLEGVEVVTAKLSADEGVTLVELLEFRSPTSPATSPLSLYGIGPTHFALTVEDLDGLYERLQRAGVAFIAPPVHSPDGLAKVSFCRDPDGIPIELVEMLEEQE